MRYRSTRGNAATLAFCDTVLAGLADDGGLYIPVTEVDEPTLQDIVQRSYSTFRDKRVAPVKKVGGLYVQELFHGPTLAFKDVALQFLGNMFELILSRTNGQLRILGATSGVRGKPRIECVILYPDGRTSKVQEMQMATVPDANIHCCAVAGTFDDCQNTVKAIFKSPLKKELSLGAVNSINWARILAQITYYFYACFRV